PTATSEFPSPNAWNPTTVLRSWSALAPLPHAILCAPVDCLQTSVDVVPPSSWAWTDGAPQNAAMQQDPTNVWINSFLISDRSFLSFRTKKRLDRICGDALWFLNESHIKMSLHANWLRHSRRYAASVFSFASAVLSRNICIGLLPWHQRRFSVSSSCSQVVAATG